MYQPFYTTITRFCPDTIDANLMPQLVNAPLQKEQDLHCFIKNCGSTFVIITMENLDGFK